MSWILLSSSWTRSGLCLIHFYTLQWRTFFVDSIPPAQKIWDVILEYLSQIFIKLLFLSTFVIIFITLLLLRSQTTLPKYFDNTSLTLVLYNVLLGIETAICRYLQSRMKYAIRAISIPPGAQRMWTRFPENRKGIDNVIVEKKTRWKA